MKFKSISIAFCTLAVASITNAQTLFHDDWESYRPGTQDWDALYSFGDFDIDLDAGERFPTVVEGPKDGVSPYSGNQMYDFRGSAIKGNRNLRHSLNSNSISHPVVDMAFRFAVPKSYNVKTILTFGLHTSLFNGGNSADGIAQIDLFNNTFRRLGAQPQALVVTRDAWNELRVRIDWTSKKTYLYYNWKLMDSRTFVTGQTPPPYKVERFSFGVSTTANYADEYPVDQGIPGMLVDDVTLQAVPEPSSAVGVTLGVSALLLSRRPRRA